MYAILQNGGKQYKITEGQIVGLEKLNVSVGEVINFDQVLMIVNEKNVKIGSPILNNIIIKAKIVSHERAPKIKIIKFRRRKHSRKHIGHRQWITNVEIISISSFK